MLFQGDGLTCPSCKTIYGEKQGNCPAGHMEYQMMSNSLPGHSDCGTIRITYSINPGMQVIVFCCILFIYEFGFFISASFSTILHVNILYIILYLCRTWTESMQCLDDIRSHNFTWPKNAQLSGFIIRYCINTASFSFQGSNHPHPGHPYSTFGFPRICFLPNNEIGRKVGFF